MFVVIKRSKTTKRELVYIVESYRDENQKIRQRIVKKCGELSELVAQDPDAIEKLKEEAKRMTGESLSKKCELTINFNLPNSKTSTVVNYGYFFIEALFDSLKIEPFLERKIGDSQKVKKIVAALKYYSIREFFVSLPMSKASNIPDPVFENPDFEPTPSLETISLLNDIQPDLQRHIYRIANKGYECDDKVASLDITSYYFNADTKKNVSSERFSNGVDSMILVQVGFLFDRFRNPIACVVFPQGQSNVDTFLDEINKLKKKHSLKKIVITADRGFSSNHALATLYESGNGYVVGRNVKGSRASIQEIILDEKGYKWNKAGTFKYKTFQADHTVGDTSIPEKAIVMWTSHNAAKMKQRRDTSIIDFLSNQESYGFDTSSDIERYISVHDTTEIPDEAPIEQNFFTFDAESYQRDLALDGYYALVTTELDIPDSVIIKRYHELQKIVRTFSVPDPDIEGMPESLWTYKDVQAYFLVSYISMVLECKLERMLDKKCSIADIKAALTGASCKNIGQDIYNISYQPPIFKEIERAFGVNLDKTYATLEMIRKYRRDICNGV